MRVQTVIGPLLVLSFSLTATGENQSSHVGFRQEEGKVTVLVGGDAVATYVYADPDIPRPYFAHVIAPGGQQVTRNHPPIAEFDRTDHHTMHPGIWMAFGDLDGSDFWRNEARVVHKSFLDEPKGGINRGGFTEDKHYIRADGSLVCKELFRFSIHVLKLGYLLTWDSTFRGDDSFYFGDQEEMGLGIRVATPMSETKGGQLRDSEGRSGAKDIWSHAAAWCDYSGTVDGQQVGMTLMCHPDNFRESWMHARDYGFVAANPFGRKAMKKGAPSKFVVKPGEEVRLRYGIWIHGNETERQPNCASAYARYLALASGAQKPNIIVIYTDDQGYGDASCLNRTSKFQTPNLDRLASEGLSLTNAHSADTVCTPSRYGLLTGRYCWRTKKKTGVLGAEAKCLIRDDRVTLASLVRNEGYHTAMVGKWHLGMDLPGDPAARDWSRPVQDMPLDKGFDYFFGVPASLNYGVLAWFEGRYAKVPPTLYTAKRPNRRHVDYRIMPPYQDSPEETRKTLGKLGMEVAPDFVDNQCLTRFTDKAIQWMRSKASDSKAGKPFFVYLPFTSPHYPVCPLPRFWGQGDCGGYGEFVIETDYHVGRILDFLDASDLDKNTMIVFSSDNGPENSWKQRIEQFEHDSSGIYRGGKRDIYEGGHRVPFFVRWPGGIKQPGRTSDRLVGQIDLLATVAEIIGVRLPEHAGEDSQSFAPVLFDPTARHERLPLINHGANGRFAITLGTWKLVMPHRKAKAELYDLATDPGETANVIAEHAELAKTMQETITDIVCRGRTTPGAPQSNDTGHWRDLTWIGNAEYKSLHID